jgi:hypothetical protein
MHDVIGSFRACYRSVTDTARDFFGVIECRRETVASFPNSFSRHVGGRGHQGPGIFRERAHVVRGGVFIFVHTTGSFLFVCVFHWQISGEGGVARFRQIGHPQNGVSSPNGFDTVSLPSGSGIQ